MPTNCPQRTEGALWAQGGRDRALTDGHAEVDVVDGDTFWAAGEKFRLYGVDTPEPSRYGNARCEQEARLGDQASELVRGWVADAGEIRVERLRLDKFKRTLAHAYIDGVSLSDRLGRAGLGAPWTGGPEDWCRGR